MVGCSLGRKALSEWDKMDLQSGRSSLSVQSSRLSSSKPHFTFGSGMFIDLLEQQNGGDSDRSPPSARLLPKCCKSRKSTRLKPGARNPAPVSHRGGMLPPGCTLAQLRTNPPRAFRGQPFSFQCRSEWHIKIWSRQYKKSVILRFFCCWNV